jgi:hypothetical protein
VKSTITAAMFALLAVPAFAQVSPPGAPQIPIYQPGLSPGNHNLPVMQPPPPPALPTPIPLQQPTYIVPSGSNGFEIMGNGKTVHCTENPYVIGCQ